ncbi:MAG: hypothetical protein WCI77_05690 [Candidatus Omnitrophota bacterium]
MKKTKKLFVLVLFMILFLSFQNSYAADKPKMNMCQKDASSPTGWKCPGQQPGTTQRQAASPVTRTAQANSPQQAEVLTAMLVGQWSKRWA